MANLVNTILQMRQQGLSNNQIVQTLQRQGLGSEAIFDAMSQIESGRSGAPIDTGLNEGPQEIPPFEQPTQQIPKINNQPVMQKKQAVQSNEPSPEELIEAIVNEKWEIIQKELREIADWRAKTEQRMKIIEESLKASKEGLENLHLAVSKKIKDYDQNMLKVGTDMKAMETIFKQVLPVLTDNVNQLTSITESMKLTQSKNVMAPKTIQQPVKKKELLDEKIDLQES